MAENKTFYFLPCEGWIQKLCKRKNIVVKVTHGKALSVDHTAVEKFKVERIREIYYKFGTDDIYNMDESGLFYRSLPQKTWTSRMKS